MPRPRSTRKSIHLALTPATIARLDELAAFYDISRSETIDRMVARVVLPGEKPAVDPVREHAVVPKDERQVEYRGKEALSNRKS